jgi:hypothetical protein
VYSNRLLNISWGLAIPSHAIDGALAMLVAALGAILYLAIGRPRRFTMISLCLLGASLLALPGIAAGLDLHLAYLLRTGAMLLGLAITIGAVRWLGRGELAHKTNHAAVKMAGRDASTAFSMTEKEAFSFCVASRLKLVQGALIVTAMAFWMYLHGIPYSPVATLVGEYPVLSLFAFGGLVAIGLSAPSIGGSMVLFALLLVPAYEAITHFAGGWGGQIFQSGFSDIGVKLQDYWCPYFFAILSGIACSRLWSAQREHAHLLLAALLILLIYPWDKRLTDNYNYVEHSIAEEWGIDYGLAMRGFWLTTENSRWTEGVDGFALVDFMRSEIDRGEVTSSTHVLHLAHDITVLGKLNRYSVFTGIDDIRWLTTSCRWTVDG